MTENEAKEMLQAKLTCMDLEDLACIEKGCSRNCDDCEYNYAQGTRGKQKEAIGIAIGVLEKIQQYRVLGTVEELRSAKEKQIPNKIKKSYVKDINGRVIDTVCYCSNCGEYIRDEIKYCEYCPECGQAIDWSEEND